MMRVVEEIAFDAPDFVVHLFPFGARLDPDFHGVELERAFAGLGGRRGGRDEPAFTVLIEKFFAVEGDRDILDAGDELFGFALGEIEFREDQAGRALGIRSRRKFESEKLASLAGSQIHVIFRRERKGENALADVVEVDGDFDWFFVLILVFVLVLIFVFILVFLLIRFLVGVLRTVSVFFVRGGFFFIAFGRERRRKILAEDDDVDATRAFLAVGGHIQAANRGAGIGAGGEIKVFAVFVE